MGFNSGFKGLILNYTAARTSNLTNVFPFPTGIELHFLDYPARRLVPRAMSCFQLLRKKSSTSDEQDSQYRCAVTQTVFRTP